jgi:hypothetical protein
MLWQNSTLEVHRRASPQMPIFIPGRVARPLATAIFINSADAASIDRFKRDPCPVDVHLNSRERETCLNHLG